MEQSKRNRYIVAGISFVVILAAIYLLFIFQKGPKVPKGDNDASEVKALTELEITKRPYATLTPTSDGAEIIISIENMGEFDKIEYELTYLADNPQVAGDKIQRGATGTDVNTKEAKYKKSVLLGTASRGVRSPDKGIEDGKLLMHMFKGDVQYDSETDWSLIEVGAKAKEITDKSGDLTFNSPAFTKDYWVILADTVGVPPGGEFDVKKTVLPVYGIFSIAPQFTKDAKFSIKVNSESTDFDLFGYNSTDSKWIKLTSKYDSRTKTISSTAKAFATFVVVSK